MSRGSPAGMPSNDTPHEASIVSDMAVVIAAGCALLLVFMLGSALAFAIGFYLWAVL